MNTAESWPEQADLERSWHPVSTSSMPSFEKEKQQSSRQQDLYWIQAGGHLLGCVVAKEYVSGCNLVV
jgi:hypothetical protein